MISGKDVNDYINEHSLLSYNFAKNEPELMISARDAWELVLMVMGSICDDYEKDRVQSNAES